MNRREFLKILALSAGASAALPAAAMLPALASGEWPRLASQGLADRIAMGGTLHWEVPQIGMVATGSGACGMLRQLHGTLPHLARSVAIDTSPFVLHRTMADRSVRVGESADKITDPKALRIQAAAARSDMRDALAGLDLVWMLTSLGGHAGTGIAPIVADVARELAIPVIAASITPFDFEGARRNQIAQAGLGAITRRVTASIELPNAAFDSDDDDVLLDAVLGRVTHDFGQLCRTTSSILSQDGLIGVDLADFRAAMTQARGRVAFGHGAGAGPDAGQAAFSAAANHMLLGAERLRGAKGAFVAIQLKSAKQAMPTISAVMQSMNAAVDDPDALMIYGAQIEPDLAGDVSMSIMAAG